MVLKHEGVEFVLLQPPFYEHHLETRLHRTMAVTTESLLAQTGGRAEIVAWREVWRLFRNS